MKTLYLRIYLTVLAILLAFALIAGWLGHHHLEHEHEKMRHIWIERAHSFAILIGNSLPSSQAPIAQQRQALHDWSQKLHLSLALDNDQGQRIAEFSGNQTPHDPARWADRGARTVLADGRILWVARPPLLRDQHQGSPLSLPPPLSQPAAALTSAVSLAASASGADIESATLNTLLARPLYNQHVGLDLLMATGILFIVVAIGAWPVVRSLTRRLELLKDGVDRFGQGHLQQRVHIEGRDEIAAVANSFNQTAQRIESLVQAHRSLLANASHELRSPLARLKMALTLMEEAPPERRCTLRAEINKDIAELDELVDEVLLSSQLDARPELEANLIDLAHLCQQEVQRIPGAVLSLTPQAGQLQFIGEERLIRRAIRNLLENAARYGQPTQPGYMADSIELLVTVQPEELSTIASQRQATLMQAAPRLHITFTVCDRGPGVPENQRERIFEPFYRLPGHAEYAGGVGLGLALVKQIAERHQGYARCEPRAGGGSYFIFHIVANSLD